MKKNYLILLSLVCVLLLSCQNKLTQNKLNEMLSNDWCECLETKTTSFEEIISQKSYQCIESVIAKYTNDKKLYKNIIELVNQKGYDTALSEYEKERLFGNELGFTLLNDAVDNCLVYREALIEYKNFYINLAKKEASEKDMEGVDELIVALQNQLSSIEEISINDKQVKKQVSYYFTVYGVLLEYKNKPKLAVEQYDKAIKYDKNNHVANGFKKIISN